MARHQRPPRARGAQQGGHQRLRDALKAAVVHRDVRRAARDRERAPQRCGHPPRGPHLDPVRPRCAPPCPCCASLCPCCVSLCTRCALLCTCCALLCSSVSKGLAPQSAAVSSSLVWCGAASSWSFQRPARTCHWRFGWSAFRLHVASVTVVSDVVTSKLMLQQTVIAQKRQHVLRLSPRKPSVSGLPTLYKCRICSTHMFDAHVRRLCLTHMFGASGAARIRVTCKQPRSGACFLHTETMQEGV